MRESDSAGTNRDMFETLINPKSFTQVGGNVAAVVVAVAVVDGGGGGGSVGVLFWGGLRRSSWCGSCLRLVCLWSVSVLVVVWHLLQCWSAKRGFVCCWYAVVFARRGACRAT